MYKYILFTILYDQVIKFKVIIQNTYILILFNLLKNLIILLLKLGGGGVKGAKTLFHPGRQYF